MVSRILALLVWAAVAASLAFWGLRWMARPAAVPPGTSSVALSGTAPRGDLTRLLSPPANASDEPSAPSQQAMLASRLQLVGVVAPRRQGDGGIALLVVDGKPARAYRTGHAVEGELVLQSVTQQGVQIGPAGGPAAVNLNLPLLPPAATGQLPSAGGMNGMGGMGNNANSMGANGLGHAPGGVGMPPPSAGRRPGGPGGYSPNPAGVPGGGMADTPVEGAEPAPGTPPGASLSPDNTRSAQQQGTRMAVAPSIQHDVPIQDRWLVRRGNIGSSATGEQARPAL